MIRNTVLALATVAILMGATAAALVAKSLAPVTARSAGQAYSYNELVNRPSYMKGKILEDCLEHPAECTLIVW